MTSYALIRHLVLKDARHQRGWIILLWVLAVALPICTAYILTPVRGIGNAASTGLAVGFFFVEVLILIRVLQLDPAGRVAHFLATRPVGWPELLASKALFIALFLFIPSCIVVLGGVYTGGFQCSPLALFLYVIESSLYFAATLAFAAIPAFYFRKLMTVLMLGVGYLVLTLAVSAIYMSYVVYGATEPPKNPTLDAEQIKQCQKLVSEFALVLTAVVTAIVRYRKMRVVPSLSVLAAGILLSLALSFWWPFNLSRIFTQPPPAEAELSPALRDKISISLWSPSPTLKPGQPNISGSGWNGVQSEQVQLSAEFKGLEPPYFAALSGFTAEATLRSGRKVASNFNDSSFHGGSHLETGGYGDDLREYLAGFTPAGSSRWSLYSFDVFYYRPDQLRGEDLAGASITGTATFDIRRAYIFRTLPLKQGMVLDLPRRRFIFNRVEYGYSGIHIEITKKSMPITLLGDVPTWSGWDNPKADPTWLVVNRRKGEYLVANGTSSAGDVFDYDLERPLLLNGVQRGVDVKAAYAHKNDPLAADWADGAEICFFATGSCGHIRYPYQIPSLDLISH